MLNPRLVYGSNDVESFDGQSTEILVPIRDDDGGDWDNPWRGLLNPWRGSLD